MSDTLCRDCLSFSNGETRCPNCHSPRILHDPELRSLSIAHVDCDSFYAAVEKRDNPELRDKPVIIGGGQRGVVSTACYIARVKGVRSAMPMFKALKLCPEAVVIKPRMHAYTEASAKIREMMRALTPLVEPLSLDEAFLDLTGTERLHGAPPVLQLARLQEAVARDVGVTVSVGLSHNKFLAKVASDLEKPRGFAIISHAGTDAFLMEQPVKIIWGVGRAMQARLERHGLRMIRDIRRQEEAELIAQYGSMGRHIYQLAHGQDSRPVSARNGVKSISNETTFNEDISAVDALEGHLWRMAVKVSDRAKAKGLAGRTINLKLKTCDFKLISRQTKLRVPTQMADTIFSEAQLLLKAQAEKGPFRLIGAGLTQIEPLSGEANSPDLLDSTAPKRFAAERAADAIRTRFGEASLQKGRGWRRKQP